MRQVLNEKGSSWLVLYDTGQKKENKYKADEKKIEEQKMSFTSFDCSAISASRVNI